MQIFRERHFSLSCKPCNYFKNCSLIQANSMMTVGLTLLQYNGVHYMLQCWKEAIYMNQGDIQFLENNLAKPSKVEVERILLLLLSHFSRIRLCVTPQTAATRLPCPWDSPGKNTGVGCHFLLQCMKVKSDSEVTQSCPTLSDPMDCSLPGSSIHGIFQAKYWSGVPLPSPEHILRLNKSTLLENYLTKTQGDL